MGCNCNKTTVKKTTGVQATKRIVPIVNKVSPIKRVIKRPAR